MIQEFAVDPEALADRQNVRYLVEKFGVPHGRLISSFPKEWWGMVLEACKACKDVEKKCILAHLETLKDKTLPAGRRYDRSRPWLSNAVSSHAENPFRAIITAPGKADKDGLLDAATLSEADPSWRVPRGGTVPRKACDIAAAVEKLLICSREIVLVDPYFSGKRACGQPLSLMLKSAFTGKPVTRFEYHLSERKISAVEFQRGLEGHLRHLEIPEGKKIVFVRWRQLQEGEKLHPRYVLTDRGGLRFDHGLDEGQDGETTDVECLDEAIHSHRWAQYRPDGGHFELVDTWIVTARGVAKARWSGEAFAEVEGQ